MEQLDSGLWVPKKPAKAKAKAPWVWIPPPKKVELLSIVSGELVNKGGVHVPSEQALTPLAGSFFQYLSSGLTTTTWADSSGNGRNLAVVAGAGTLGSLDGKPTFIAATGSPQNAASASWTVGNPSTIYLIVRTGANFTAAQTFVDGGSGSANSGRTFWRTPAGGANLDFGAITVITTFAPATGTLYALCGIVQAGTSDEAYINNWTTPNATASAGNGTQTGISLGAAFNASQTFLGEIVSCVGYAAQHDAVQRAAMAAYFMQEYPSLTIT